MSQYAFDTFKEILEVSYFMAAALIITLMFCLIEFHSDLNIIAFFGLLFIVFFAIINTVILISKAVHLRGESQASYNTFQRFDIGRSKMDVRNWNSSRPITVKIGTFGYIKSHGFLLIFFGPVVLDTLLTLLLTF